MIKIIDLNSIHGKETKKDDGLMFWFYTEDKCKKNIAINQIIQIFIVQYQILVKMIKQFLKFFKILKSQ